MSDSSAGGRHASGVESYDRELSLKGILWTGAGLAVIVVVFAALMWFLSGALREMAAGADAPIPILPEARTQQPPPEPRLQTSPEADMRTMRAEENAVLDSYGWVDETAGTARVPIERAMELLVEHGLPDAEAASGGADAGSEPAPAGTPADSAAGDAGGASQ